MQHKGLVLGLIGVLVFAAGLASGAAFGMRKANLPKESKSPAVLSEQNEVLETPSQSPPISPRETGGEKVETHSQSSPVSPSKADGTRGERIKKPYASPVAAPKPNICEQAGADLAKRSETAQKIYEGEQQEIPKKLSDLTKRRSDAVNNYLTGIALATSKYNSATSTDAYTIYQQEQGAALNTYTQTITGITSEESAILETKKASQQKYDEAQAASQAQYQAKISGQNCP